MLIKYMNAPLFLVGGSTGIVLQKVMVFKSPDGFMGAFHVLCIRIGQYCYLITMLKG